MPVHRGHRWTRYADIWDCAYANGLAGGLCVVRYKWPEAVLGRAEFWSDSFLVLKPKGRSHVT
jgi:hypothetical protein